MRVLVFGFGPLPGEGLRVMAPGLRTWHILSALRTANHDIYVLADRIYGSYPENIPNIVTTPMDGWTYMSIADSYWHDYSALRKLVSDLQADCAVAVTTPATSVAAEVVGELPLWGDLYGSIMAEAQTKALTYADDSFLRHFWQQERKAIERCDIFSTVSERQKWSLIGELGMWGRLNQWTSGYDFATTIPICSETTPYILPDHKVIRGVLADDQAFVLLYSGGYNTWTDVDTLFTALEQILSQRPEVVFVSTGGKIEGHDDLTYMRFQSLISTSPYRERIHLCGWVPQEDVPAYYAESDVGVNVDRISYEAQLGARTRVLDWMRAGLPAIMSSLTEISEALSEAQAGLAYQPGNVADLVRCFEQCAADREATQQMGMRARQLLLDKFTFTATTERLLAWVAEPKHAPDYGQDVPKLVKEAQEPIGTIGQIINTRALDLGLALRVWPTIARVTDRLGLKWIQRWLIAIGMRALRLERAPYAVQYRSYIMPPELKAAQKYEVPVLIRNAGRATWTSAHKDEHGVNLCYHWLTPEGDMLIREGIRTLLPTHLQSGHSAKVSMALQAPDEPGSYILELDLVQEGVTWFRDVGAVGPKIKVQVLNAD
jgi:glycosyltransferase involved in cell wall biosynthesis